MLISAIILAGTAAGGEGESGAKEQNAASAAGEDADNLNTNAGDKPSSASGKLQRFRSAIAKVQGGLDWIQTITASNYN